MGQNYPSLQATIQNHSRRILDYFHHFIVKCYAKHLFFFFFYFILFFHIDITRLYKPVLKISINCSLWGQPGKKPIIKCHGDKQTSLEKDLQMRCHYKISKKEKVHSKYYQKHLNLVSTFSTSGNINFFFLSLFFCYVFFSKITLWCKGEMNSNSQMWKRKQSTRSFKKGEKRQLQRNNRNMLYTSVESTHTNTSPAISK